MKTTLPLFLLFAFTIQAQTQIDYLNGDIVTGSISYDGWNYRTGIMAFTPETNFNQSAAGFDQHWDVSDFTINENSFIGYENFVPTEADLFQFPGAIMKTSCYSQIGDDIRYSTEYFSSSGLMSYVDNEYIINYATDNADYGPFPKTYGDLYVDNIAGVFNYGEQSALFTGTIITEVDAYGELTTPETTFEVTRLKTVQTLQLNYPGFDSVGSFVQTTYRYYRDIDAWPFVKSTNNVLVVDALGININTTHTEQAPSFFLLSIKDSQPLENITLFPNPVSGTATIVSPGQNVLSVSITDNSGKVVFSQKENAVLDLSALPAGVYLSRIVTDKGTVTRKVIKK